MVDIKPHFHIGQPYLFVGSAPWWGFLNSSGLVVYSSAARTRESACRAPPA